MWHTGTLGDTVGFMGTMGTTGVPAPVWRQSPSKVAGTLTLGPVPALGAGTPGTARIKSWL